MWRISAAEPNAILVEVAGWFVVYIDAFVCTSSGS